MNGIMYYVDPVGNELGYEGVTKIKICRDHYAKSGLGADFVDSFMR